MTKLRETHDECISVGIGHEQSGRFWLKYLGVCWRRIPLVAILQSVLRCDTHMHIILKMSAQIIEAGVRVRFSGSETVVEDALSIRYSISVSHPLTSSVGKS